MLSGFTIIGETKGFANARGEEIAELLLELRANASDTKNGCTLPSGTRAKLTNVK
jgi:hypothetical protein